MARLQAATVKNQAEAMALSQQEKDHDDLTAYVRLESYSLTDDRLLAPWLW
jgi:pyrimidine deaminase RibD-like protein